MRRFPPFLALAGLFCGPLGACAPISPPACAQPEVLALLAERLHQAGRDQVVEAGSVGQVPGAIPGRLHCAARVRTVSYNTERLGRVPVVVIDVVQYTVEMRRNGIFLLPEAPGSAPSR